MEKGNVCNEPKNADPNILMEVMELEGEKNEVAILDTLVEFREMRTRLVVLGSVNA